MNIFRKTLIFISSLLFFELCLFFVLGHMLDAAESELTLESRRRALVNELATMGSNAVRGGMLIYLTMKTRNEIFQTQYENASQAIVDQVAFTRELANYVMESAKDRQQLYDMTETAFRYFEKYRGRSLDATAVVGADDGKSETQTFVDLQSMISSMNEIIGKQRKSFLNAGDSMQFRRNARIALMSGVVLNIIFALFGVVAFSRMISQRVGILVDNTRLFAQGKPLHAPVQGADEIAKLDSTFREMCTRLDEMEAMKRNFISMYSHDIRSPLTSVYATLEMLKAGTFCTINDRAIRAVDKAERACEEVLRLINNMLNYERLELGGVNIDLHLVDVDKLVNASVESLDGLLLKKQINVQVRAEPLVALGDSGWLSQVTNNLLGNAIKFSPEGGTIELTARKFDAKQVEVSIKDEGPGIDAADQERIFERFEQTKVGTTSGVGVGFGIGLSVCKAVILAHQGEIGVESSEGNGSRFWFRLPLAELEVEDPEEDLETTGAT